MCVRRVSAPIAHSNNYKEAYYRFAIELPCVEVPCPQSREPLAAAASATRSSHAKSIPTQGALYSALFYSTSRRYPPPRNRERKRVPECAAGTRKTPASACCCYCCFCCFLVSISRRRVLLLLFPCFHVSISRRRRHRRRVNVQ